MRKIGRRGAAGLCEKKNCDISELALKIDPEHWPLFLKGADAALLSIVTD